MSARKMTPPTRNLMDDPAYSTCIANLRAAGYVILSSDEVRGIRDEALEEAIKIASRHPGTKFTNSRGHLDWRPADNHDAAAAIRSLKGGRDAQ